MDRTKQLKIGDIADNKIISWLKQHPRFKRIWEIRDNQKYNQPLDGIVKLENDINMKLGIDYVIEMENGTYYLDTKGATYKWEYYGRVNECGIVSDLLLQYGKIYSGIKWLGWANNPYHWTNHIMIYVNEHIYILDYYNLICFMQNTDLDEYENFEFKKGNNKEYCVKVPMEQLQKANVILDIVYIGK